MNVKTLGERIRELRTQKDLSLREFAKKLGGLSAAFLSDIELGRRHPSNKVLADIAKVLDIALDELRKFDTRAPVEDLKRLASSNPAYGFAFRKLIDKRISPEELIKLANKTAKKEEKK
ncbi:MAG: helix-turn-helix transcriptional regulator [Planctomycetota bacterium]